MIAPFATMMPMRLSAPVSNADRANRRSTAGKIGEAPQDRMAAQKSTAMPLCVQSP